MVQQLISRFSMKSPYFKAVWLSIALHLILLIGLLSGDFSSEPKPLPTPTSQSSEPIKAVVVDKAKFEQAVNKIKRQKKSRARCREKAT